jgi:hypothetical protein
VNDHFADNDTDGWAVADLDPNGTDRTWSAPSGTLACAGVITVSGTPDGGTRSVPLINDVC